MRALAMTAVVLLGVALAAPALAQNTPASRGTSAGKAGQAPTGHRQPRALDTPPADQTPPSEETNKQLDRELDRKLKGICRGC